MKDTAKLFKALTDVKAQLENKYGFNIWGIFLQGSQNYNLEIYSADYQSDIDMKAFIIPTFDELYSGKRRSDLYQTEYGQVEVKDIRELYELLKKANPAAIELMFTDFKLIKSHKHLFELGNQLVQDRLYLIYLAMSKMVYSKLKTLFNVGNARQAEFERCGYDPKEYHHILRGKELLMNLTETGNYKKAMQYDLDNAYEKEIADYLIDIKVAKTPLPIEFVKDEAESAVATATMLSDAISIESHPVKDDALDQIYDIIKTIIKSQMLYETKANGRAVYQTHSHFKQLSKDEKAFAESLNLGIDNRHFVDIIKYVEYEVVNFWEIDYKKPKDKEESTESKSEESVLLSPLD